MSLAEKLNMHENHLRVHFNAFTELLELVPAIITTVKLEEQGNIVLELRRIKDSIQSVLKSMNKSLTIAEQHLCTTIAYECENGITYQHPKATITATAKGWFNIDDPTDFFNWIFNNRPEKSATVQFVNYATSKKARAELCEEFFENGEKLPDGIKEHIVASVQIRRKANE